MSKGSDARLLVVDLGKAYSPPAMRDCSSTVAATPWPPASRLPTNIIAAFREFLKAEIRKQQGAGPILPKLALDGALAVSAINVSLVEELSCLRPSARATRNRVRRRRCADRQSRHRRLGSCALASSPGAVVAG